MPKLPTEEQFRMREIVNQLAREEVPLAKEDLHKLGPFVRVARTETIEVESRPAVFETMPDGTTVEVKPRVGGSIRRVDYHVLNERGLKMKFDWDRGLLDSLVR
jgi:hypothetical protein